MFATTTVPSVEKKEQIQQPQEDLHNVFIYHFTYISGIKGNELSGGGNDLLRLQTKRVSNRNQRN